MPKPSGNETRNDLETGLLDMYSGITEVVFFALTCFLTTYIPLVAYFRWMTVPPSTRLQRGGEARVGLSGHPLLLNSLKTVRNRTKPMS